MAPPAPDIGLIERPRLSTWRRVATRGHQPRGCWSTRKQPQAENDDTRRNRGARRRVQQSFDDDRVRGGLDERNPRAAAKLDGLIGGAPRAAAQLTTHVKDSSAWNVAGFIRSKWTASARDGALRVETKRSGPTTCARAVFVAAPKKPMLPTRRTRPLREGWFTAAPLSWRRRDVGRPTLATCRTTPGTPRRCGRWLRCGRTP